MFGRVKKGDYVAGLRAKGSGGWGFSHRGRAIVKGMYMGRMNGLYMVQARRNKIWLCSSISKL